MKHTLIMVSISLLLVLTMITGGYFALMDKYGNNAASGTAEVDTKVILASNPDDAEEIAKNLYKYNGTSVDNSEQISALVSALKYLKFEVSNTEIKSGFLVIDYHVDNRAKYRYIEDDYNKNLNQTCATLFVLCPDLRNVKIRFSDDYGTYYDFSREKNTFIYTLGKQHEFTNVDFENAAESIDTFTAFTKKLLQLKNTTSSKLYLKEIYGILPENLQIQNNSSTKISIVVDDKHIHLLKNIDIDISSYKHKPLELYFCAVEDYTDPNSYPSNYVFVFSEQKIVRNDIINSKEQYNQTINLLKQ